MKTKVFILIFTVFSLVLSAQTKKNIELIFNLVDESLEKLQDLSDKNIVLKFNAVDNLDVLKGRVVYNLKSNNDKELTTELNYTVDSLQVNYPEMFRDGLFGDYLLVRDIKYKGYYSLLNNNELGQNRKFQLTHKDTVYLSELNTIETQALDFTKGEVPAEPFFESVIETVIAVGAAAISIILFFTVRSE